MNDDLGVARRLKQAAATHQLTAHLVRVGQIAVVADGEPAELEIGEERLHIAHRDLTGRRVANMADGDIAAQPRDHLLGAEIVADLAETAVGVELFAVIGDDPGRFLPAMLQCVQAEGSQRCRVGVAIHGEDAAFLVKVVRFEGIGRRHPRSSFRHRRDGNSAFRMRVAGHARYTIARFRSTGPCRAGRRSCSSAPDLGPASPAMAPPGWKERASPSELPWPVRAPAARRRRRPHF